MAKEEIKEKETKKEKKNNNIHEVVIKIEGDAWTKAIDDSFKKHQKVSVQQPPVFYDIPAHKYDYYELGKLRGLYRCAENLQPSLGSLSSNTQHQYYAQYRYNNHIGQTRYPSEKLCVYTHTGQHGSKSHHSPF